jgi:hypothetical protein
LGSQLLDLTPALIADPAPFLFGIFADRVSHLGFSQRLLSRAALAIELSLRGVLPLELFGDRSASAAQLLHDALQPGLVVPAHPLSHCGRGFVSRAVQLGQPLFVLSPLLQKGFDGHVGVRRFSHGKTFLSSALRRRSVHG